MKHCSIFANLSFLAEDDTRDEDDGEGKEVESDIGASKNSSQTGHVKKRAMNTTMST